MRKILHSILVFSITITIAVQGQKVGINTNAPASLLDVFDANRSEVLLSTDGYVADTTMLIFRNMQNGITGTEFMLESRNEEGLLFRSSSDLSMNTEPEILRLLPNGKVGIGQANPASKLDVNGWITLANEPSSIPKAGAIRFNSDANDFEGFDGVNWKSLTISYSYQPKTKTNTNKNDLGEYTFGWGTAMNSDFAVAGDPGSDLEIENGGVVYVYKPLIGSSWGLFETLSPSNTDDFDYFGQSVAIDGNRIIVGAPYAEVGVQQSGSAYVFECDDTGCQEVAILVPNDPSIAREFGKSVAISGNYIIVGAPKTSSQIGAAYIFRKSGSTWSQLAKLNPSNGGTTPQFGTSVDIAGTRAIVGSPYDDENGTNAGAANVFLKTGSGQFELWLSEEKLFRAGAASQERFGQVVRLTTSEAAIGAPHMTTELQGGVIIFSRDGTTWTEEQTLNAGTEADDYGRFGFSLDLKEDYLLIGAIILDGYDFESGTAYLYQKDSSSWEFYKKISDPTGQHNDRFGWSVSMADFGFLIGAPIFNSGKIIFGDIRY